MTGDTVRLTPVVGDDPLAPLPPPQPQSRHSSQNVISTSKRWDLLKRKGDTMDRVQSGIGRPYVRIDSPSETRRRGILGYSSRKVKPHLKYLLLDRKEKTP